jgi:hypothetical protein
MALRDGPTSVRESVPTTPAGCLDALLRCKTPDQRRRAQAWLTDLKLARLGVGGRGVRSRLVRAGVVDDGRLLVRGPAEFGEAVRVFLR